MKASGLFTQPQEKSILPPTAAKYFFHSPIILKKYTTSNSSSFLNQDNPGNQPIILDQGREYAIVFYCQTV
jgi:hypothetical protein